MVVLDRRRASPPWWRKLVSLCQHYGVDLVGPNDAHRCHSFYLYNFYLYTFDLYTLYLHIFHLRSCCERLVLNRVFPYDGAVWVRRRGRLARVDGSVTQYSNIPTRRIGSAWFGAACLAALYLQRT